MAAVAFVGEDAVGTIAGYVPEDGSDPVLVAAWVRAGARGKGVGDALVAEVPGWSRECGYEKVYLRVADGNDAARKLFLRNSFTPTRTADSSSGADFEAGRSMIRLWAAWVTHASAGCPKWTVGADRVATDPVATGRRAPMRPSSTRLPRAPRGSRAGRPRVLSGDHRRG
jgi:Acetyltransferase (GNAT) family